MEIANHLPIAIAIADLQGRVEYCNPVAREMLEQGEAIHLVGDRLACRHPADHARLYDIVRKAVEGAEEDWPLQLLVLGGAEANTVAAIRPLPVGGPLSRPDARALIIFHDLDKAMQVDLLPALRGVFRLPSALARFSELLVGGCSLREAAERLGITEASARIYMKRVLERTETTRQADLVRRLTLLSGLLPARSRNPDANP